MAKTMTPSVMTEGQVDKLIATFVAAVRKHREEFELDAVQQVLGVDNLGMELLDPFRRRVEALSNLIVRRIKVDRTHTPQQVLDATGRKQYVNSAVVSTMPAGEGEEVEVVFFKVGRFLKPSEVSGEFALRNLMPDPRAQAAVNKADPAFADQHPNGTQWQDAEGNYNFLTFDQWDVGERRVDCNRGDDEWGDDWWFAGVRK